MGAVVLGAVPVSVLTCSQVMALGCSSLRLRHGGLPEAAVTFSSCGGELLRILIGWASLTGASPVGCACGSRGPGAFTSPVF